VTRYLVAYEHAPNFWSVIDPDAPGYPDYLSALHHLADELAHDTSVRYQPFAAPPRRLVLLDVGSVNVTNVPEMMRLIQTDPLLAAVFHFGQDCLREQQRTQRELGWPGNPPADDPDGGRRGD
jgi:hypothetical protein